MCTDNQFRDCSGCVDRYPNLLYVASILLFLLWTGLVAGSIVNLAHEEHVEVSIVITFTYLGCVLVYACAKLYEFLFQSSSPP